MQPLPGRGRLEFWLFCFNVFMYVCFCKHACMCMFLRGPEVSLHLFSIAFHPGVLRGGSPVHPPGASQLRDAPVSASPSAEKNKHAPARQASTCRSRDRTHVPVHVGLAVSQLSHLPARMCSLPQAGQMPGASIPREFLACFQRATAAHTHSSSPLSSEQDQVTEKPQKLTYTTSRTWS